MEKERTKADDRNHKGNVETQTIVHNLYSKLNQPDLDRDRSFSLEKALSNAVLSTEENILAQKSTRDVETKSSLLWRRSLLKRMADGLVWKFFGFNEHFLQVASMPPPAGYMAHKNGYGFERKALEFLPSIPEINFAIQNDTTNILRLGDVTLLHSQNIYYLELKGGKFSGEFERTRRQSKKYEEINQYLASGNASGLEFFKIKGVAPLETIAIELKNNHYWLELENVVNKTLERNNYWAEVDDGMILIGLSDWILNEQELGRFINQIIRKAKWNSPQVRFGILSRHLDIKKADFLYSIIPLTAFDIDPKIGMILLDKSVEIMVLINLDFVYKSIGKHGYELAQNYLTNKRSDVKVQIGERRWNRLIYGLYKLPDFIDETLVMLRKAEKEFPQQ